MKFRYVTEKLNQNGSKEVASVDFPQSELLIGRGGNSHLILSHRSVSLVHAKVTWIGERLFVEDQNSLAGIRVNGKRSPRSELSSGDTLQVGDLKLLFSSVSKDEVVISREIDLSAQVSEEEVVNRQLTSLSIKSYLP